MAHFKLPSSRLTRVFACSQTVWSAYRNMPAYGLPRLPEVGDKPGFDEHISMRAYHLSAPRVRTIDIRGA
jgi:hypothetical protein